MSEAYEIRLRMHKLSQLFFSLDPSPFREREFDPEAERFIVSWAPDSPRDAPITIAVELPQDAADAEADAAGVLADAVANNFAYRMAQSDRELRELFRTGRRALLIGVPILALSLIASRALIASPWDSSLKELAGESLLILGWVANWRPLEIFLYDWWPILRHRALYKRLAAAQVEVHRI